MTEAEVGLLKQSYSKWIKEWRQRRKSCLEAIDQVCEAMEKKRKVFMEELGLEDDPEDIQVYIQQMQLF